MFKEDEASAFLKSIRLQDAEQIADEVNRIIGNGQQADEGSLFKVQAANKWLEDSKVRPIPKMLFGELWHEGELCILYADTGLGKSALAVQIGDSITTGRHILNLRLEAEKQKVLYFDFELSDKQFEARCSNDFQDHYSFSPDFLRAEIDPEALTKLGQIDEVALYKSFEKEIIRTGAKTLIVDNITYLKNDAEKAKDALTLMRLLKKLKSEYSLSILVLAHTPKRDPSQPITGNHLAGSRMLLNFCDASFTIGISQKDKSFRYIKQIKARSTENIYDAENVLLCQLVKTTNLLKFDFVDFASESEHLQQVSFQDREAVKALAVELSREGKSQRQIAAELGIAPSTVNKYLHCSRTVHTVHTEREREHLSDADQPDADSVPF